MARKQLGAAPSNAADTATKNYVDTAIAAVELLPGATGASGTPGASGAPGASGVPGSDATVTSTAITTALGYTPESTANKAQANGYASLDSNGRIPVTQLPNSVMEYQGTWSASGNSPSLSDGTGSAGDVYRVSVAGTRNLGSGNITFDVGDYVIYSGSVWQKADTTDAVSSVAGRTGDITLTVADISGNTATALGVGSIELGHASDTTLSRSAAGKLAVEGTDVLLNGGPLGTPSSGNLSNCTVPETLNSFLLMGA